MVKYVTSKGNCDRFVKLASWRKCCSDSKRISLPFKTTNAAFHDSRFQCAAIFIDFCGARECVAKTIERRSWQCDQMTRLFVQHLATYSIEMAQIGSQSCIQILPNSKQTHWKWPNTVRISPKWPNFCKSGHTGSRWSDLTTHSGFTVTLIGSICIGRVIDELASLSLSLSLSHSLSLSMADGKKNDFGCTERGHWVD